MLAHPRFNVSMTAENMQAAVEDILKQIKPEWQFGAKLRKEVFDSGITNQLVGYFQEEDTTWKDMVLFRIYGEKTELFINRHSELVNFRFLHARGLAPPLMGTFENGYCYGFTPGRVVGPDDLANPDVSMQIAKMIARLHSLKPDAAYLNEIGANDQQQHNGIFAKLQTFLDLLPSSFDDAEKQGRFEREVPAKETIVAEVERMENITSSYRPDDAYCHNDLLGRNIILNETNQSVLFIDYEYASMGFAMYDIGNHFDEFAGVDVVDYSRYPSKEFQLVWLRTYLNEYKRLTSSADTTVTEAEVEARYVEVSHFSLVAHLLWGTWALFQARHSAIDFDFLGYAILRLNEFEKNKSVFLAL